MGSGCDDISEVSRRPLLNAKLEIGAMISSSSSRARAASLMLLGELPNIENSSPLMISSS
jgi:hypothetical protein